MNPGQHHTRVLLVDADPDEAFLFQDAVLDGTRHSRLDVDVAAGAGEALLQVGNQRYDVLVVDCRHLAGAGPGLLRRLREQGVDTPAILLITLGDGQTAVEAVNAGAKVYPVEGKLSAAAADTIIRRAAQLHRGLAEQRAAEEVGSWLAAIVDSSNDAIVGMTLAGIITSWNVGAERLYGYSAREALGRPINFLAPEDRRSEIADILERLRAGGKIEPFETVLLRQDGTPIYVSLTISPVRDSAGKLIGAVSITHDITQRELAAQALEESERHFRALIENATDIVAVIDADGTVRYASPATERVLGYAPAAAQGTTVFDLLHPEDRAAASERFSRRFAAGETPAPGEFRYRHRDGSWRILQTRGTILKDPQDPSQPARLIVNAWDITDQKLAEEELRESEERYRTLFELSPLPMWVSNPETLAILAVNAAAIEHYGYSRDEFLAMTLADVRPPDEVPRLLAAAADPTSGPEGLWKHRKKDGTLIDVEVYTHRMVLGGQLCRLAILRDVTEQKKLEEQLRAAQRLEAIGRLASGIAHDFNNLLTAILGYSDILAQKVGDRELYQSEIAEIRKAGERAAALTRQLLAFSRRQVLSPEVIDLNAIVADMEKMLRRLIGENLELQAVLEPGLGRVKADPGQIEQVIMNLAVNARDAMPDGGRLTIETRNVELDEDYAREHVAVRPGPFVLLAVSDTGTGIDDYTRSRLFEPFFTTKEQGKGTGLGLSTIYGIVKQSGGSIWVYSELGHGTTFKVYLPRVEEPLATEARGAPAAGQSLRGHETVLVAEDDNAIRLLVRLALERHGYAVLVANGGGEALEVARGHRGPIHVLVTDMLMPGMSGPELASQIAATLPGIKILFMSGYTGSATKAEGGLAEGAAFLEKPFTAEALVRKVRELLNA